MSTAMEMNYRSSGFKKNNEAIDFSSLWRAVHGNHIHYILTIIGVESSIDVYIY